MGGLEASHRISTSVIEKAIKTLGIVTQTVEGTLDNPGQVAPGALADVDAGRLGFRPPEAIHAQALAELVVQFSLKGLNCALFGLGAPEAVHIETSAVALVEQLWNWAG